MNTTRLTILAVILSAFVVERTFAQDLEGVAVISATPSELGAGAVEAAERR